MNIEGTMQIQVYRAVWYLPSGEDGRSPRCTGPWRTERETAKSDFPGDPTMVSCGTEPATAKVLAPEHEPLWSPDRSGCSSAPSMSDFGRVEAKPSPKRAVPLQADIDAVRDALDEAEATAYWDDGFERGHARALRDTLESLLAEQRREIEATARRQPTIVA